MQNFLNLWRIRNITLEGKIIIFKPLVLSKIAYLTLTTSISKQFIEEIQKKLQKSFIWNNLTRKIKHETQCNSFEEGGLKYVEIARFGLKYVESAKCSNTESLQCSWIKDYMMISFKSENLFYFI